MRTLEPRLQHMLLSVSRSVQPHAPAALLGMGLLTALLGLHAATSLRVDSNTIELFPEHLPARSAHDAFVAEFPDLENALFVVIDGPNAEATHEAAGRLEAALRADLDAFTDVEAPGTGAFFERTALLYRSLDELDELTNQLAQLQPVLVSLERDPSVAHFAELIEKGLDALAEEESEIESETWRAILEQVGEASVEVYAEAPLRVSWGEVFVRGSAVETTRRRVLVVQPVLDWSALLPAAGALAALDRHVASLGLERDGRTSVRATGNPAITHEETLGLIWDIGVAGLFCLGLVAAILMRAFRSVRLAAALVSTLLVGLVWTAAFAATAVGALNVISIAAGVLFVGLGVDFGIHLLMHYAAGRSAGEAHAAAWEGAVRDVGLSLVLCALTTSIGFLAFLPTDYQGVAELGLITAAGLGVILLLTFTWLPAWLSLWPPGPGMEGAIDFERLGRLAIPPRLAPIVLAAAGGVAIVSFALLPRLGFEPNIVAMRDPDSESVRTFNALLADADTPSPWHANSIAADLDAARGLARALEEQPAVARAVTLADYVPEDQAEKRALLHDLAFLLEPLPTRNPEAAYTETSSHRQLRALERLRDFLRDAEVGRGAGPLADSIRALELRLTTLLGRVEQRGDAERALAEFERLLLSSIPDQMARLRLALDPPTVTLDGLPAELVRRMATPDGRARVQSFPAADLSEPSAFRDFVDQVRAVDAAATGVAINLLAFASTTQHAFREALATAWIAITAVLIWRWRRLGPVAVALAPLMLAALATAGVLAATGIPFSFFNIVVIPLILGAGVDSAIHLVERARAGEEPDEAARLLVATPTARAVLYSALTTIASFGTLAFSGHRGIAGLGALLAIGMGLMLLSNLVVLPALLRTVGSGEKRRSSG